MKHPNKPSSLIHGCDIISTKLAYCLSPMGFLFRFEPNEPRKARPLPLSIVLGLCIQFLSMTFFDFMFLFDYPGMKDSVPIYSEITKSTYIMIMFKFFEAYRIFVHAAIIFVPIIQHGPITSVISQGNYIISDREQAQIAKYVFNLFLIRSVVWVSALIAIYGITNNFAKLDGWVIYYTMFVVFSYLLNLTSAGPFMYVCYLGLALGRHVVNFSSLHVEPLFDQFEKQQIGDSDSRSNADIDSQSQSATSVLGTSGNDQNDLNRNTQLTGSGDNLQPSGGLLCWFKRLPRQTFRRIMNVLRFLNSRGYPNLGDSIDLNKSDNSSKISESTRIANTHLIRNRLRKTQVLLSELRDTVNDINKMSSMLAMALIVYDSIVVVLVTTASIQAKIYKSVNIFIIPTISYTVCVTITVFYICLCLDRTTSQLKLMINKLFDFIIMNLRVKLDETNNIDGQEGMMSSDQQLNPDDLRELLVGSKSAQAPITCLEDLYDREDEVQSETWFQFQYTRKLAGTIHFTMGGLLPVSRRLVLPTLAHILSAVFISIEIMSIVDTLGQESTPTPHHQTSHSGVHPSVESFPGVHGNILNHSTSSYALGMSRMTSKHHHFM